MQSLYSPACNMMVLELVKCSTTVLKYEDTLQYGPDYVSCYSLQYRISVGPYVRLWERKLVEKNIHMGFEPETIS